MKMFVYGPVEPKLAKCLAEMNVDVVPSAEHNGRGLAITWKCSAWVQPAPHLASAWPRVVLSDKRAAARRNQFAASMCDAVVIVRKPKFFRSVVSSFRARARRTFWWNGETLREVEPARELVAAYTCWPLEVMFEPDRWAEAQRAKRDAIDEASMRAERSPRTVFADWSEKLADVECSREDVLHADNAKTHGLASACDMQRFQILLSCMLAVAQQGE